MTSVPHARNRGCSGCSRRTILRGLGYLAAGIALAGCTAQSDLPNGSATACNSDLCLDLTAAANAALATVGGAVLVEAPADTIVVITTAANQYVALSAVCTHAGCTVDYNATQQELDCPCHGSVFKLDGSVVQGPAGRALAVYAVTVSGTTLTVTLA